nr:hypothetical protein BaRGS_035299 [Batillaria attramentaria]
MYRRMHVQDLRDHGKLYNDLYGNFKDLRQSLHDFKAKFLQDTAGIPVMADCLKALSARCGGAKLKATREKRCIQLHYDSREISEQCSGLPEDVLESLELYNKMNRLIKGLLDKAPQVSRSLALVLDDEQKLKREVTKSDLPANEGPDAMRACTDNINRLRKLPVFIETILKYTEKIFREVLDGSKVLLDADDDQKL